MESFKVKGEILDYGLLRASPRNDVVISLLSLRSLLKIPLFCHCEQVFKLAWQSIILNTETFTMESFKVKGEILDYGLLRASPRNDVVISLLSLRSLYKRLWQTIIKYTCDSAILSLRECVAFVAIYNFKYRNLYNGILKVKGEILDYGLLRLKPRNDAVVKS